MSWYHYIYISWYHETWMNETSLKLQGTRMRDRSLEEFCTIVSKVSSFVGNSVSRSHLSVFSSSSVPIWPSGFKSSFAFGCSTTTAKLKVNIVTEFKESGVWKNVKKKLIDRQLLCEMCFLYLPFKYFANFEFVAQIIKKTIYVSFDRQLYPYLSMHSKQK